LAALKTSPLTPEAQAQLKADLNADITDAAVLAVVMSRLDEILRNEAPHWEDGSSWQDFAGNTKEPTAEELARFHAQLACDDIEGSIANNMAARAAASESGPFGEGYAKTLASALLDESCRGGEALTRETRAALKNLVSAP
jgi:hypothetical protein